MATKALNDLFVKNLKAGTARLEVYDTTHPGLVMRVAPSGRKTWSFDFTSPRDGKRAKMTLGTYPHLGLREARDAVIENRRIIQEEKRDPRDKPDAGTLLKDLYQTHFDLVVKRIVDPATGKVTQEGLASERDIKARYETYIGPSAGETPIKAFTVRDLNKIVDPILKSGKKRTAAMVYSDLQKLFNFATARDDIPYNHIKKAKNLGSPGNESDRYLKPWEIRTVWTKLPTLLTQSKHVPVIVKLCLLTGQRISEVCGMSLPELDFKDNLWTIPKDRTKNGDEHWVPLAPMALKMIQDAVKGANKTGHLFPNRKGDKPFTRRAVEQALERLFEPTKDHPKGRFAELMIEKWTPHDLRRTVATHMSLDKNKLNIPELHIGHVLNHRSEKRKTVTRRVYNRNDFLDEKRAALVKWERFLKKVISGAIQ